MSKRKRKGFDKTPPKERNWLAIHAHFKTGAGSHGDKKKQDSKKKCRGKVSSKDWS
tara:strand:+ start:3335 stop:3502 length:168 start_codon:yes stop_codon:yes gene_type:complete